MSIRIFKQIGLVPLSFMEHFEYTKPKQVFPTLEIDNSSGISSLKLYFALHPSLFLQQAFVLAPYKLP